MSAVVPAAAARKSAQATPAPAARAQQAPGVSRQGAPSPAVEQRAVSPSTARNAPAVAALRSAPARGGARGVPGRGGAQRSAGGGAMQGVSSPAVTLAPVVQAINQRAAASRRHSAPEAAVASAQAAAIQPRTEQARGAAVATVTGLDATDADAVRRDEFRNRLRDAIRAATPNPTTEAEANTVIASGGATASQTLRSNLATEQTAAAGPLQTAAQSEVPASSQPAPTASTLRTESAGAPPAPVSAGPAVPAPLPPERLDYSADRGPTEQVMQENNITQEQLQEGNDPAFGPALQARSTAERNEATTEARYRQGEGDVRTQAQAAAQGTITGDLAGMHGAREQQIGQVATQQVQTRTRDAQERERITNAITAIKDRTRADVEAMLTAMETEAGRRFEDGLKRAEQAYANTFEEAKGGIGTWLTTWGDSWDRHIRQSLVTARAAYMAQVDVAIDDVATYIDGRLRAAKQRVADGRKQVDDFVRGLDASVRQFGEDAAQAVSSDFDTMGSTIDQRRDGLINRLTEQYRASSERMSQMEQRLRDENRSLWRRVRDATVGVIRQIIEFKNMLLGMLGRAAAVVELIIAAPIRFLGNLVAGVMAGLRGFLSKIDVYLMRGIMDWIMGALAGAGLQLPDRFDLRGIISLALQIFGLTYANFRQRAVNIVGETVVSALETTAEVFTVLIREGVGGLWRFIQEQLQNLRSMVVDAIFNFIKERVIMAGITWIIGLLNPASAFFKACKAIYDIVMFFVNRGRQILTLVNAVIDSMGAIARGNISVAATFVENALARAVPVAIGFLASLLGVGDPSAAVRAILDRAQAPVNRAMDWVINLAARAVRGLVGRVADWWRKRIPFRSETGESHTILTEGEPPNVRVAVQSEKKYLEDTIPLITNRPLKRRAERLAREISETMSQLSGLPARGATQRKRNLNLQLDQKLRQMSEVLSQAGVLDQAGSDKNGTRDHPYDLHWQKPALSHYPSIYLLRTRIPGSSPKPSQDQIRQRPDKEVYRPHQSKALPGGEATIGVAPMYQARVDLVVGPRRPSNFARADGQKNRFIRQLGSYGYDFAGARTAADHVVEEQVSGPDAFANLWPFDSHENSTAGSRLLQTRVQVGGGVTKRVAELEGKYFKIVSVK